MNEQAPNKAPVMAGWIALGVTWLLFLIPFPGLGLIGWVGNLVALVLSIIVMSKGETAHGVGQLVCSLLVSPIVYFIGLALFVGVMAHVDQM